MSVLANQPNVHSGGVSRGGSVAVAVGIGDGMVQHCLAWSGLALHGMVGHGTAWYGMVRHGTAWYCMLWRDTA